MATKTLNIQITIDPSRAMAEAKKLQESLIGLFNVSTSPLTSFIGELKQVYSEIQKIQGLIAKGQSVAGAPSGRSLSTAHQGIQKVNKELVSQQEILDKSREDWERYRQKTIAMQKELVSQQEILDKSREDWERYRQKTIAMQKEFAKMRSYKTTPYEYEPVHRIKPYVEKQLPYKHDVERQLYAQLSTAEKIIKMTQDRLRNGLLLGASEDVKTYMNQMLNLAQQVSPQLRRQVAGIFRETGAMDIVKEYNKGMQEIGKLSELIGIRPNVIKGWNLATEDIKKLSLALKNLKADIEVVGIDKVNRFYRDVISQSVVKGSGKELGMLVKEADIENIQRLKKDIPEINAHLAKMGIEADKTHGKLGGLWASAKSYMKFQMGWFLGAGIIFSIIASIRQLAVASMEFEQTMKNIQAVTGIADSQLNMIANTAKRVSAETPITATEVAKLGLQLVRAGLEARDAAAALEVAAKVAVISGEDMKIVADAIATAMMAWKLGASEAERVGNTLAIAMNKSRLTVQDIGVAFNYVAGAAASMNIPLEETLSVLAVMSNLGVRASTMATGWTQFMARLTAPTRKLSEYLEKVGADIEKLDPMRIQGPNKMATAIKELERIGFTASDAFRLFETRAARFFLFIKTAGPDALIEMEREMRKTGKLQEAFNKSMEGLKNTLSVLWNKLLVVAIAVGEALTPALKELANILGIIGSAVVHTANVLSKIPSVLYVIAVAVWAGHKAWKAYYEAQKLALGSSAVEGISKTIPLISRIISLLGPWGKAIATVIAVLAGGTILDKIFGGEDKVKKYEQGLNAVKNSHNALMKQIDESVEGMDKTAVGIQQYIDEITTALSELEKGYEFIEDIKMPEVDPAYAMAVLEAAAEVERLELEISELSVRLELSQSDWEIWKDTISALVSGLWGEIKQGARETFNSIKNFLVDIWEWAGEYDKKHIRKGPLSFVRNIIEAYQHLTEESRKRRQAEMQAEIDIRHEQLIRAKESQELAQKALGDKFRINVDDIWSQVKKISPEEQLLRAKKIIDDRASKAWVSAFKDEAKRLAVLNQENMKGGRKMLSLEEINKAAVAFADKVVRDIAISAYHNYMALRNKHIKGVTKDKGKDTLRDFFAFQKRDLDIFEERMKGEIENQKRLKELAKMDIEATYKQEQEALDLRKALNEQYYQHGIITAEKYYAEKARIMDAEHQSELKKLKDLHDAGISMLQRESDERKKYLERIEKDMTDISGKFGLAGGLSLQDFIYLDSMKSIYTAGIKLSPEQEELLNKYKEYIKLLEQVENEIAEIEHAMKKANKEYENQKNILDEVNKNKKKREELDKAIKQAVAPIQKQIDEHNLEKERLQVLADAYEITNNFKQLEETRIELLKLENQLRELSLQKRIAELQARREQEGIAPDEKKRLDEEIRLLERLKSEYEKLGNLKLAKEQRGPFEAMRAEFEKISNDYSDMERNLISASQSIASGMENAFMQFFDRTSANFMNFGNLAKAILHEIYMAMVRAMIVRPIVGAITNALGLGGTSSPQITLGSSLPSFGRTIGFTGLPELSFHEGGYIPRYHYGGLYGGLASDEVPAILQRGEYVVSRRGVEALDRINRGDIKPAPEKSEKQEVHNYYYINAVDAKSFADLVERNPGAITKVLHEDKRSGGHLWR